MNGHDQLRTMFPLDTPIAPSDEFAERLRSRIAHIESRHNAVTSQKEDPMSDQIAAPTVIPYLTVHDARAAIDFYQEVFGAEIIDGELYEMDDGRIGHVSLQIGEARVYVSDEFPEVGAVSPQSAGASTMAIVINVADSDATYAHALEAGATAQRPVEQAHGGRSGWFIDPWGHRWSPFTANS